MSDRVFFSLCALLAAGLIALALVWPQGQGTRSPGPFGGPVNPPPPPAAQPAAPTSTDAPASQPAAAQ